MLELSFHHHHRHRHLVLLLSFLSLLSHSLACPADQKQALLEFKSSLLGRTASSPDGPSLFGLETWDSKTDCCRWERVTCRESLIVALQLDSLVSPGEKISFDSSFLTPLFSISSLMLLDLSFNYITGELPGKGLANLTKLVHLEMIQNRFSGQISPEMFQLKHLQNLDLSNNELSGALTRQVSYLQELRVLNLEGNFLQGNIPEDIGNSTEIRVLSLRGNSFSGNIPTSIL
ncbi:PREDICTED: receptor-like protein 12 [Tarenaya hassleriana]|uniref:receptor-like protein 12 n=1 Tax=Tarenaya hassleriana TaxID=28532 RepID=UPI0008FD217D|nr:PREDICTED: receptor-like protein 12 [Tarenaya hassleriana]